jgi:hypothetical protein
MLFAIVLQVIGTSAQSAGFDSDAKAYRDIKLTPSVDITSLNDISVRADAEEIANLLNIKPLAERIITFKKASPSGAEAPRPVQQARLLCLYKLFTASQEVRKASAIVDLELATSNASLDALTAKRDMTINIINSTNFLQGGTLGTTKQSMALHGIRGSILQEVAMTSFGTSIGLSLSTFVVPSLWREHIPSTSNSLALVLDESLKPPDGDRSYLWRFLNASIPGDGSHLTRRDILKKHWQTVAAYVPSDRKNAARLSANSSDYQGLTENIAILNRRIALLHDLKTHMEEFDGSLFELHKAISIN